MSSEIKAQIKEFFSEYETPEKTYSIKKDGRLTTADLSPSLKAKQDAVYRFKDSKDRCYYGYASDIFKRASKHLSDAANESSRRGKTPLAQAVRESTDSTCSFGVLFTKDDVPKALEELSIQDLEMHYIDYKKSQGKELLNRRRGGGGGAAKAKTKTYSKQDVKASAKKIRAVYKSPEKSYPIDSKSLRVQLTPTAKGSIYVIKKITDKSRYVGKTERKIQKRMSEHSSFARNKDSELGHKRLYKDMRKAPEDFVVKLYDPEKLGIEDLNLCEKALIQHFKEQDEPLYNKNDGGGGGHKQLSSVRKKLFT
jgi:predicted GIY-YIG superfamily endonuclease